MGSPTRSIQSASGPLRGSVRVPGSKSLSNRAIIIASLARGESEISGLLRSDDTESLLRGVAQLGVGIHDDGDDVRIDGCSGSLPDPDAGEIHVDCGHGGTPARFLLALACLSPATVVIDGSDRLRERPMADGIRLLRELGAEIEAADDTDHLPVRVVSGSLRGGSLRLGPTASSQFISSIMLIAPFLDEGIEIEFTEPPTSAAYIRLTALELEAWGVGVELDQGIDGLRFVRIRPGMVASTRREIEPDASSAAYWAVAAAINPGSSVQLLGVHLHDPQPDVQVLDAISRSGAGVDPHKDGCIVTGPVDLRGWDGLDASMMPDGAMALSILASCALTASTIDGLHTLRIKETDRLAALQTELRRCGSDTLVRGDSILIRPISSDLLLGTAPEIEIQTYDDHRMAMAFSILGLRRGGIRIIDPDCVSKSYPDFYGDLEALQSS